MQMTKHISEGNQLGFETQGACNQKSNRGISGTTKITDVLQKCLKKKTKSNGNRISGRPQ